MALGLRFALVFGMILAMAVAIRTIATGAAPQDSQRSASTAPIAGTTPIYRPQLWNLF